MPELPEVESLRLGLERELLGRRIERVEIRETRLRYPLDADRVRVRLEGRQIETIDRRAKYLLFRLDEGMVLLAHLGMSGSLVCSKVDEPLANHVHVRFGFGDGVELRFRDPRRFGCIDALDRDEAIADPRLAHLGPEPLSEDLSGEYLRGRAHGSRRPVKTFLMDAGIVVGVGNIYASEALFLAGIHPHRPAGRIATGRWARLVRTVKEVLSAAVERGGTTISDWHNERGDAGSFQQKLAVYGRDGEPCTRCGRGIRRVVTVGRSTYYCPGCQR